MSKPTALVTGAAQGIGFACAQVLAEDGFELVLCDVKSDEVKSAAAQISDTAIGMACDVSDQQQVEAMFDQIERERGPVAALVNNAGISRPCDFLETTLETWQQVLNINLTGTFLVTQRAARAMVEHKIKGSIVNMSSVNDRVAIPTIAPYCASKGGVMQLTKTAALSLAPHGIRVNAVGPGSIDTAMMAGVNPDSEAMDRVMSRTPLKRIGEPREVANVVAFLAGDKSSYISGEVIYIDGGRLAMNYTC
ncbi:MAG: SDR family NAD(P)-dependent oxidoreductase [Pseudomonadota bacterium]